MGVLGPTYSDSEVELLGSEVLPQYLSFFHNIALDRLVLAPQTAVLTAGPLATTIAEGVTGRLPSTVIKGFEPSEAAVTAALERTTNLSLDIDVEVLTKLPIHVPDATFTHALLIHPLSSPADRQKLLAEMFRLLVPAGQLLFASPLRGSYPEIADMLREFSLKHDRPKLGEAVEIAAHSRPTPETLVEDLERLGFTDVSVDVELLSVPFDTGRDFAQSNLFRLLIAPEISALMGQPTDQITPALEYAGSAVSKYWSDGQFDLTVNLACASGRRPS